MDDDVLWVFGYSSLIWKHGDLQHERSECGFIDGFVRRFWQRSDDHRGTSTRPGLVASVYSREDYLNMHPGHVQLDWHVHGRAFLVAGKSRDKVMESLDGRETGGYQHLWLPVYTMNSQGEKNLLVQRALVYIAPTCNPNFAGILTPKQIADVVHTAHGKSGSNREYVQRLAIATRAAHITDTHLEAIMSYLRGAKGEEAKN